MGLVGLLVRDILIKMGFFVGEVLLLSVLHFIVERIIAISCVFLMLEGLFVWLLTILVDLIYQTLALSCLLVNANFLGPVHPICWVLFTVRIEQPSPLGLLALKSRHRLGLVIEDDLALFVFIRVVVEVEQEIALVLLLLALVPLRTEPKKSLADAASHLQR